MATTRKKKQGEQLLLPDESWGDRLHRCYREARRRSGGKLNYREAAARISRITPTTDAALIRLEANATVPYQARSRLLAWLALQLYGYDPAAFGLTETNTPTEAFDPATLADLLKPLSPCLTATAA